VRKPCHEIRTLAAWRWIHHWDHKARPQVIVWSVCDRYVNFVLDDT
jgi:hypothetical protein